MSQLEVVADGRRYMLSAGQAATCGRSASAEVVLTDRRVGRAHARLSYVDGVWVLTDLASSNGTWIGGTRIATREIGHEVTAYLGNPVNGALLYLRPHPDAVNAAPTVALPAETVPIQPGAAGPAAASPPSPTADTRPLNAGPAMNGVGPIESSPLPRRDRRPIGPVAGADGVQPAQAPAPQTPSPQTPSPQAPAPQTPAPPAPQTPGPQTPVPQTPVPQTPVPQAGPPGRGSQPPGYLPVNGPADPWYVPGPPLAGTLLPNDASEPGASVPVLVLRLGSRTLIYPMGQQVRIGRDSDLEAVTDHPLVSRNFHGVVTSDAFGATYTDSSSRGSYLDGKALRGPLRITEPVTLRLGDPATGEELGVTPPLSFERLQANRRKRVRGTRLKVIAACAVVVLLLAGAATAFALTRHHSPSAPPPTGLSAAARSHAETATVRLLMGTTTDYQGWGSGTVISPDGLILTNAHVAAPRAPGLAVALATPGASLDPDVDFVTVEFTTGESSAVIPRYRARPVATDGYLDLSVLRIYATADGTAVDRAALHLPYLPLGDVKSLALDQNLTIFGYPGVSSSDSITVTNGGLSTFIPDPAGHVADPRFLLETTARVAHGNSGGAAITDAGALVGVPSLSIPGEGSDLSWRLRSVADAAPLIAAATAGQPYQSKILTPLTGSERVQGAGIGPTAEVACGGALADPVGGSTVVVGFGVTGLPDGLDVAFHIALPDGTAVVTKSLVGQSVPGLPEFTSKHPSGCLSYAVTASSLGLATMPPGTYQAQLLGGPNLDPLGPVIALNVAS